MKVSEIFESIEGEGIRVGFPVTFIRLYGCNLNCSYCDSRYACEDNDYKMMSISDILDKVNEFDHKLVTLTGGEPLLQPDAKFLIQELLKLNYKVNIETNGAMDISPFCKRYNVIVTLDYKCPTSGMEDKMLLENLKLLKKKDVLKFVVGSEEDLQAAKRIIQEYNPECSIYLSPVFGSIEPKEIVEFLLKEHIENARVQLQIHKFIWEPDRRGV